MIVLVKISIDSLADEITNTLKEYTEEVEEGLEKEKQKVARSGAKELRDGPKTPRKTGEYAKGWTATKRGTRYVIRNRTHYQLTHLLEKGHAKRGGGRVPGRPHIRPVEAKVIKDFEKGVEKVIRG